MNVFLTISSLSNVPDSNTLADGAREAAQSVINHAALQKTITSERSWFKHETKVRATDGLTTCSLDVISRPTRKHKLKETRQYDEDWPVRGVRDIKRIKEVI